jgi:hypothetical protein
MRRIGRGWSCEWEDLPKLPENQRKRSADGSRIAAWYILEHFEDAYDDETEWEIVVWDVDQEGRGPGLL